MPVRYSWSDVVSGTNLNFTPDTTFKRKHVEEILDALAKYRATYKYSDMSLLGWWWHRSSEYAGSSSYYNGWTAMSTMRATVPSGSYLRLTPTSTSAYMQSLLINIYPPARAYQPIGNNGHRYLIMKVRSSVALSNLQLRWTTTSATGTWRTQVLPAVTGNSQWQVIELDLNAHANWTGSLRQLRIYPMVSSGTIDIEYLLIDKEDLMSKTKDPLLMKASEISNIRKWAARANGSAGSSASVSWTDASLTAGSTIRKAIHFKEIRDQINSAYGKNRGWSGSCDGYSCYCDYSCDGYEEEDCDCDDSCDRDSCGCDGGYGDWCADDGSCLGHLDCYCDSSSTCDDHSCWCDHSCNWYYPEVCDCEGRDVETCFTCHSYVAGT